MASDRIFGLVALMVALAYVASATQIQTSFLSDPIGPKAFPILVGAVAAICSLVLIVRLILIRTGLIHGHGEVC